MSATVADATGLDLPTTDPDAIGHCWDAIVEPGDVHEVRIPKTRKGPCRLFRTVSGYFDNRDAFVREVERIMGADASAVYVTLNPAKPALLARAANRLENDARTTTSDADIVRLAHLLIDADPIRPADISATDDQRDEAVKVRDLVWHYLRDELGWPLPSVITMSGNGGGLLYRIDLPNDPEAVALLQRTLQGLSALFSTARVTIDTTTYNPARITKIVGTVAAKGDHLPAYPWRQATGRFNPNPQTVSRAFLESVAAFAPKPEPRPSMNGHAVGVRSWDIKELLRRNGVGSTEKDLTYATSYTLDRCLTSQDHTAGACILEFPSGALSYTCRHNRCAGKRWEDVRPTLGLPTGTDTTTTDANARERVEDATATDAHTDRVAGEEPPPASVDARAGQSTDFPWPTLDAAALHGLAGDVVRSVHDFTESSDVALLVTFLVEFGAACNRGPHIFAGEDRHGTNQDAALVGPTSKARKGASKAGPERVMRYADPDFVKHRIQGGLSSGEGLIWAVRDAIVRLNKKGEPETVDPGIDDKRLLCIEEEFSAVLKVAEREQNTVSEQMRKAFDGRDVIQTMTKSNPAKATNAHISILGHISVQELRNTITEVQMANGLGNRFGWFLTKRARVLPRPGRMSDETVKGLGERVKMSLAFARAAGEIDFDAEALEMWTGIYGELSDGKPGLLGAMVARGEVHVLRWSMVYALLDRSKQIKKPHLEASLALWDYAEASAKHIFGSATGDPIADRILAELKANSEATETEIREFFSRNVSSTRTHNALALLEKNKLAVRWTTPKTDADGKPKAGRPTTWWKATG